MAEAEAAAAAANATQPIDWNSTNATTTNSSATDGSTWADPATDSSTWAAEYTGCRTEWINDAKLNFLENCRVNDYKFKPQCETFWFIDYGYSLDADWDVCNGERANDPGCQQYYNWYVEEVPCDEADEADEALETQGDQGVAEVIDEQTLAEDEEDPLWLKITGWTLLIAIVGYVIY